MRTTAILTVRNEGAFLLEWLAHHRAAGVTDFLVFSNNCQDGTDLMLDRIEQMGWLTHLRNDGPYDKQGIQFTALKTAAKHPLVQQADWLMSIDIDEFINIHVGDHTLDALWNALPHATAIPLTWRLFGNSGVIRFEDAPITETFTKAAPAVMHWPWRAAMFKTLYRNDGTYKKPGVHRPRQPDKSRLLSANWFDGSGRELGDRFKTSRIFSNYGQDNYQLAQLNHYPLGAMESYVLKAARGRVNHDSDPMAMDYWVERNFNSDEDCSIQSLKQKRNEVLNVLKADETLLRLHENAVQWRHKRFDELMLEEPYRALFSRLLMAQSSKVLSPQQAALMQSYGRRAQNDN